MNFSENDVGREKTKLPNFKLSKLARAKVLLKLEFDTEDQVLFCMKIVAPPLTDYVYPKLPPSIIPCNLNL